MARLVELNRLALALTDDVDPARTEVAIATGEPELRDLDLPLGAEDAEHVVETERDRARHFREDATLELQGGRRPLVDAALAEPGRTENLDRVGERLAECGAGHEPCDRDRITADIEDAAAGEIV